MPSYFKLGEPEYIASLVSYLASEEAHYLTGTTFLPSPNPYSLNRTSLTSKRPNCKLFELHESASLC